MPKKEEKKGAEFDFGFGKAGFSFGGLFEGLGKLIEMAQKLKEAGGEVSKEGEFDFSNLKKGMKGVYGFTIKSALGGKEGEVARKIKPIVEPFGNIKPTPKGAKVEEVREPMVDVFDEEKIIHIIAEMPGVGEGDIKTDLKGDILDIYAEHEDRKYHKEILLPKKVKADTFSSSFKDGMLEIKIDKEE